MRTDADGGLETLATFYMDGDKLVAEWNNESYRAEVEADGIRALIDGNSGRRRISDGRLFYDALEDAYWRASMMIVTKLNVERE